MTREDERGALSTVMERLQRRFPDKPAERVSEVVAEVTVELEPARIRDYLPLLVEKEALARLRSSQSSG